MFVTACDGAETKTKPKKTASPSFHNRVATVFMKML